MEVNQVYSIVNSVSSQALGTSALTVVDAQSLVSLGDVVINSSVNTETFLNTLVARIGRTIVSYRQYRSKFASLVRNDFEWGAILQKIKVNMPVAESDESYGLVNGQSVDMYKVRKPNVEQKLFTKETPYQFAISIQRHQLKEAFTSESAMGGFIQAIFGEVQNAIELSLENLARIALCNYIGEVQGTARAINLLSLYGTVTGETLTVAEAKNNPDFIRFATGIIKQYSKKLTDMSTLYNDGSTTRHTPYELQKLFVMTDFITTSETLVQYGAFNDKYVKLDGYEELSYLQSSQTPDSVTVNKASDGSKVTVSNIVACLFDIEALGLYKKEEWVSTTPFNAAGGYANTFWHEKQLYFNDLSENFVMFYLA